MPVAAVLLAAGAGSRFVADTYKLLAQLPAQPGRSGQATAPATRVVDRSLAAVLAAGFEQVVVVTGAVELWPSPAGASSDGPSRPEAPGQCELVVLHNPDWANGLATSLQAAVSWAQHNDIDAIVVGLADQPFVGTQPWQDVATAIAAPGSHQIAVATYDAVPANPVGLKQSVWHLLPQTGDEGARQLIRSNHELWVPVPCQGTPSDIDTVEDLKRWT